jgi:hypothetical protein
VTSVDDQVKDIPGAPPRVAAFEAANGAFTAAIIARLGALSALWLVGLVAVAEVARVLFNTRRHATTA